MIGGMHMKRLIVAAIGMLAIGLTSANAADVYARPRPSAPPPAPVYAPPPFSWTGFYLGGNIGGAWAHRDVTDSFFGLNFNNGNNNGVFIGGGQVGYNWQFGYGVLGIEADFDGVANSNNTGTVFTGFGPVQVTSNNRWITTVAARFGVTNGNWLFYGKAGGGWIGNEDFTVTNLRTGSSFNISNDSSNGGWLVGAGIEWAFAANWSAKVEYNYLGLEDRTFIVPAGSAFFPGDTFTRSNRNIQMVKGGINYRFNWGDYRY